MADYPKLFSKGYIGSLELPNRLISADQALDKLEAARLKFK